LEQRFADAIDAFEALASNYGERAIYDLYIERSKHFIQEPPGPDWDGVFTFTTK
jgi:adenylate cyclase